MPDVRVPVERQEDLQSSKNAHDLSLQRVDRVCGVDVCLEGLHGEHQIHEKAFELEPMRTGELTELQEVDSN